MGRLDLARSDLGLDNFVSVVRQEVPTFPRVPSVVVISQGWPCWLSTVLLLQLELIGGFFALRFHAFFQVPDSLSLESAWATMDKLTPHISRLSGCAVLALGSLTYLAALEHMLATHDGPFAYAVDSEFSRTTMRDALRLCQSVAGHKLRDGYDVHIAHHRAYGGAMNACHVILL